MLDSFVLTGGFELPCFRLRADGSAPPYGCVCVSVCGHTYEQASISSTDVPDPWYMPDLHTAEAQRWCPLGLFDEKMRKKTRDEIDDRRPFHQSPSRALLFNWTRTIFSGPDSPAWRPLNPSLCLRPSMFHHAHRHKTPSLSHLSIHPFIFISSCQPCTRLQAKFTSPGAIKTCLQHMGTNSRPHTHKQWC